MIALAMGGQSIRDKPSKPDAIDIASTVHGDGNGPSQPNAEEQKKEREKKNMIKELNRA